MPRRGYLDVLDQHDGLDAREVGSAKSFKDVSIVYGSVAVCHLDVAPAFERREQHEQVGGAVALVLVIDAGRGVLVSSGSVCGLGKESL